MDEYRLVSSGKAVHQDLLTDRPEQVLALPVPKYDPEEAWYIAVVPNAATGGSCLTKELPKMAVFMLPDKEAKECASGMFAESPVYPDKVIDAFERAVNDRSKAFDKKLIKIDMHKHAHPKANLLDPESERRRSIRQRGKVKSLVLVSSLTRCS